MTSKLADQCSSNTDHLETLMFVFVCVSGCQCKASLCTALTCAAVENLYKEAELDPCIPLAGDRFPGHKASFQAMAREQC